MTEATLKRHYRAYLKSIALSAKRKPGTKPISYEKWKPLHIAGLS